jgi:hypothetical protein
VVPGSRLYSRAAAAGALALVLLAPRPGEAQSITGFAIDRFEPAAADSPWMSLDAVAFEGHLRPAFAAAASWAWKPLVFYDPSGNEQASLVRQQAYLNLDASLALWDRARVDLGLPVPLVNSGDNVQILDRTYAAPHGWGLGDLRLGADVRVLGRPHDPVRGSAGFLLFLPTGGTSRFTSDGGVRFWPRLTVAGDRGRFTWSGRVGLHLRPSASGDLAPGHELTFGAGGGWRFNPRLLATAELALSAALSSSGPFSRADPPTELLVSGHYTLSHQWSVSLGLAPGLTNGPGSPVVRAVAGVQYDMGAPPPPPELPATPPAW